MIWNFITESMVSSSPAGAPFFSPDSYCRPFALVAQY
jgi:hypothetical protein